MGSLQRGLQMAEQSEGSLKSVPQFLRGPSGLGAGQGGTPPERPFFLVLSQARVWSAIMGIFLIPYKFLCKCHCQDPF